MEESEQVSSFDRWEFYGWASGLGYWVYARMFSLPILLHSSLLLRKYNQLPDTSKSGQSRSSQSSLFQTITLSKADDFCLWAPTSYSTIGDAERYVVVYCTKAGQGTRLIPDGALQGVRFVRTGDYVQVSGEDAFAGLVFGSTFGVDMQYHEWTWCLVRSFSVFVLFIYIFSLVFQIREWFVTERGLLSNLDMQSILYT